MGGCGVRRVAEGRARVWQQHTQLAPPPDLFQIRYRPFSDGGTFGEIEGGITGG
jgi:hypothetical protein